MRPPHHLFLCKTCAPDLPNIAERIQMRFYELAPPHIRFTLTNCLSVCRNGPIMVVYPEAIWYHKVDEALFGRIVQEHMIEGRPVAEYVFQGIETPADAQARREAARAAKRQKGLIIVNTGHGKGKTTAAIGMLLRAKGRTLRVGGIQFLKHENANYGELRALKSLGVALNPMGDGWTWKSQDLQETQAKALQAWEVAKTQIASGDYDVFLLDEFTYLLSYGWLEVEAVVAWLLAHKPPMLHVIITGRNAPPALIAAADLVTEMNALKHPLVDQGIRAQKGIEF
nr:cob(I)yrinic acid a,c-diamide adenosyltransferase [Candidatus Viridilinea mediisalina]